MGRYGPPMRRTPEPELMDTAPQARAYAEADFAESDDGWVRAFLEHFGPMVGRAIDLMVTLDSGESLAARAVVVLDESGNVAHSQLVGEIADEPDYDAAIAALG